MYKNLNLALKIWLNARFLVKNCINKLIPILFKMA